MPISSQFEPVATSEVTILAKGLLPPHHPRRPRASSPKTRSLIRVAPDDYNQPRR